MTHQTGRTVTRGIAVRVMRSGVGAPLLFLHGAGAWPAWLPFFERLAQRYAVTVAEHHCFGASDDPPLIRNVADLAMYYLDVLDVHYSAPVHVVGHSLGGWIATEAAVRNSGRFKSLTLLAPAGIRVKGVPPGDTFIWSPEEGARNRYYDQKFADAIINAPPPGEDKLNETLQNSLAAVKFGWEPRWYNPDLEKWLHRVKVPTQVVWGRHDKVLPSAYAPLWAERVAGADVTVIEACGQSPHIEQADAVTAKVTAFLDRVPA